jgi:hypothetical protein
MTQINTGGNAHEEVALGLDGIVFSGFVERDPRTVASARQWVEAHGAAQGLATWASTVLPLGAQVLALGEASGGLGGLATTVAQLAERAEAASNALAAEVSRASTTAAESAVTATRSAAEETTKALAQARAQAGQDLAAAAKTASASVSAELGRLLGGEDAPVAKAVLELVRKQMEESEARNQRALVNVVDRANAAWDADNPASPVAALERRLAERQERQHASIVSGIEAVRTGVAAVAVSASNQAAAAAAVAASPAKGRTFEEQAGIALEGIAASLGGTYTATGDAVGSIRACKKGDGILEFPDPAGGEPTRIVVEMTTTGAARKWGPYLDEAMKNRDCDAALGVVPSADLVPGGVALAPSGPGRIILAFEPESGGLSVMSAACTLLMLHAQREAARRRSGGNHAEVDARLAEAEGQLAALADTLKAAAGVRSGVAKVITGIEACQEGLARSLGRARSALRASADDPVGGAAA